MKRRNFLKSVIGLLVIGFLKPKDKEGLTVRKLQELKAELEAAEQKSHPKYVSIPVSMTGQTYCDGCCNTVELFTVPEGEKLVISSVHIDNWNRAVKIYGWKA